MIIKQPGTPFQIILMFYYKDIQTIMPAATEGFGMGWPSFRSKFCQQMLMKHYARICKILCFKHGSSPFKHGTWCYKHGSSQFKHGTSYFKYGISYCKLRTRDPTLECQALCVVSMFECGTPCLKCEEPHNARPRVWKMRLHVRHY